jgi:hypothetical protein
VPAECLAGYATDKGAHRNNFKLYRTFQNERKKAGARYRVGGQ